MLIVVRSHESELSPYVWKNVMVCFASKVHSEPQIPNQRGLVARILHIRVPPMGPPLSHFDQRESRAEAYRADMVAINTYQHEWADLGTSLPQWQIILNNNRQIVTGNLVCGGCGTRLSQNQ